MSVPPSGCPQCGGQVHQDPATNELSCPACGWRSKASNPPAARPSSSRAHWYVVGILPVILAAIVMPIAGRQGGSQEFVVGLLLVSAACCLLAGFGVASGSTRNPVARLFLGLIASGGFAILNLTIGALGVCAAGGPSGPH